MQQNRVALKEFQMAMSLGAIKNVILRESDGCFSLAGVTDNGTELLLTTARGDRLRLFRNPGKVFALIREMGVIRFRYERVVNSDYCEVPLKDVKKIAVSRRMKALHAESRQRREEEADRVKAALAAEQEQVEHWKAGMTVLKFLQRGVEQGKFGGERESAS